jgi:hypothetical protein
MPLKAGTKKPLPAGTDGYTGSMAEAMELAFLEEWPNVMGNADLPAPNDQMKLMFIAIAKGVIRHINDNKASFKITTSGIGSPNGTVTGIDTTLSDNK